MGISVYFSALFPAALELMFILVLVKFFKFHKIIKIVNVIRCHTHLTVCYSSLSFVVLEITILFKMANG